MIKLLLFTVSILETNFVIMDPKFFTIEWLPKFDISGKKGKGKGTILGLFPKLPITIGNSAELKSFI